MGQGVPAGAEGPVWPAPTSEVLDHEFLGRDGRASPSSSPGAGGGGQRGGLGEPVGVPHQGRQVRLLLRLVRHLRPGRRVRPGQGAGLGWAGAGCSPPPLPSSAAATQPPSPTAPASWPCRRVAAWCRRAGVTDSRPPPPSTGRPGGQLAVSAARPGCGSGCGSGSGSGLPSALGQQAAPAPLTRWLPRPLASGAVPRWAERAVAAAPSHGPAAPRCPLLRLALFGVRGAERNHTKGRPEQKPRSRVSHRDPNSSAEKSHQPREAARLLVPVTPNPLGAHPGLTRVPARPAAPGACPCCAHPALLPFGAAVSRVKCFI